MLRSIELQKHRFTTDSNPSVVQTDWVAVEEPLEIELWEEDQWRSISITMRTPGHDLDLGLGFLRSENIVRSLSEIRHMGFDRRACEKDIQDEEICPPNNRIQIRLSDSAGYDPELLNRNFYTTSSCGVCGKASLQALEASLPADFKIDEVEIPSEITINQILQQSREAQSIFHFTGGLHAASLFDRKANLLAIREDVGRHNAMDKLSGWMLRNEINTPDKILVLSGRLSFELIQKAIASGIACVMAVGAPSSLALELAKSFNIRCIGFAHKAGFNVYT